MLSTYKGTTIDIYGCEFQYICLTQREWVTHFDQEGWPTEEHVDRDYIVFDGKGTGQRNVVAQAKSLKDLKKKMGEL